MSTYLLDLMWMQKEDKRQTVILELIFCWKTFICLQFFVIFKGLLPPTYRLQEKGSEIFLGKLATEENNTS